jgi:hypothetical protein
MDRCLSPMGTREIAWPLPISSRERSHGARASSTDTNFAVSAPKITLPKGGGAISGSSMLPALLFHSEGFSVLAIWGCRAARSRVGARP